MTITKSLISAVVTTVAVATLMSPLALAWHPHGTIQKEVRNVTQGSVLSDANDASTAVAAHPGDTLTYSVVVSNTAAAAANHDNDMTSTVMTDTLPAGVELVSNPSQRTLHESLGTLVPGQKVTKSYTVKVTANAATTITNQACFTGNTAANDNAQSGCDTAIVSVTVPETPKPPVTSKPSHKPTPTPAPAPVSQLPVTGSDDVLGSGAVLGLVTYGAVAFVRSRRG